MSSFLKKILTTTRADLDRRMAQRSLEELKAGAAGLKRRSLGDALAAPGISLIAEIKRASPSKGSIREDVDVAATARMYEQAGARAVSVLTEEHHFHGSLADLRAARQATGLPLLRKDFIIDPYQVWEAAAAGADAILLIVAALDEGQLSGLYREAAAAGLECLVEVHDAAEMAAAGRLGARNIGINNRNLSTFEVTLDTTVTLARNRPTGSLIVGESGISTAADVERLRVAGVDGILVGESLMRSADPVAAIAELLGSDGHGRS